jgi:hypothetical protein
MTCFACEQEPTQQCPRCGRPYCDDHGEDVCDACLEPSSGLPSFTLYRGSLIALLIATGLAIFLILQPPGDDTNAAFGPTLVTQQPATATVGVAVTTPPPNGTQAPQGTQTPQGTRPAGTTTPGANPTATRPAGTSTPGASGSGTVTVASGDTLSSICDRVKPASMSNPDCVDFIVTQNNLTNANDISVGETLRVPQ